MTTPESRSPSTSFAEQLERDHTLTSVGRRITEWRDLCERLQAQLRLLAPAATAGERADVLTAAEETISKGMSWIGGFICSGPEQEERKAGMVEECRETLALIRSCTPSETAKPDWRKCEDGDDECKGVHLQRAEAAKGGEICAYALLEGEFYEYRVKVPPLEVPTDGERPREEKI